MDRTSVITFIASQISEMLGVHHPVGVDDRLDDLPLDSLQCLELTAAVEDRFDIAITCSQRVSIETVGEFADLVLESPPYMLKAA